MPARVDLDPTVFDKEEQEQMRDMSRWQQGYAVVNHGKHDDVEPYGDRCVDSCGRGPATS